MINAIEIHLRNDVIFIITKDREIVNLAKKISVPNHVSMIKYGDGAGNRTRFHQRSAPSSYRRRRSSALHLIIQVPRRIKNSRYPNGYLEFLDWGTYFDRNPGRGFTSKRSFIIIEVSTDILGIVPVISVFFTPRISITGRDQRIRRGRRTPHSGHIVVRRVVKTHIGSA